MAQIYQSFFPYILSIKVLLGRQQYLKVGLHSPECSNTFLVFIILAFTLVFLSDKKTVLEDCTHAGIWNAFWTSGDTSHNLYIQ